MAGLAVATVMACTFDQDVSLWIAPWFRQASPDMVQYVSFLAILALSLFIVVYLGIRTFTKRVVWERLTWPVQAFGLLFGWARGLWWAGLILWLVAGTGEPYLVRSIQERSLFSPGVMQVSHEAIRQMVGWTSGPLAADQRLIPSLAVR